MIKENPASQKSDKNGQDPKGLKKTDCALQVDFIAFTSLHYKHLNIMFCDIYLNGELKKLNYSLVIKCSILKILLVAKYKKRQNIETNNINH